MSTVGVCLTFDFDAMSLWLGSFNTSSPTKMSQGEFGARVGAPRILEILERHGLTCTWFIPGHTVDSFPDLVKEIAARGHEIGHHGYCHESPVNLTEDEERAVLDKGIESIERVTGSAPVGYRSPAWDLSPKSVELFVEYGFEYDSSLMGRDFELYRCRVGDVPHKDRAYEFGTEVDVVEVPVSWALDDFPQFEFVWTPMYLQGLSAHEKAETMWLNDFRYMAENVPDGVFTLTMHPQVIGRGARIKILERLIEEMKSTPGVRFMRVCDVAREWKKANPLPTPSVST